MIRVAINGFGRIGRLIFRECLTGTDFDIVAINSTKSAEELSYLAKYDTVHRSFHEDLISYDDNNIIIANKKKIRVFTEKEPVNLPWKELNIDLVFECTGLFTDYDSASKHIEAGAKKVLISAPGKGDMKTIVYGVNDNILDGTEQIVSASSCTTNCLAPVLKLINDTYGIEKGFMTTIHAYTSDQNLLDGTHKKGMISRRGRGAAENIVPTTTGAASSIDLVIPELKGKLDGLALRVPVADGSLIDITLELNKDTEVSEINKMFKDNQSEVIKATEDPVTSSDIIGKRISALVDLLLTNEVNINGKKLFKIIAWYDNEAGYASQMMRTAKCMFK